VALRGCFFGGGGGVACGSDFLGSRNPEEARLVLKLRARARWLAAPSGRELALDRRQAVRQWQNTEKHADAVAIGIGYLHAHRLCVCAVCSVHGA
jgi:hypothetical protein